MWIWEPRETKILNQINMKTEDVKSFKLKLASPEEILDWSHGEVTKPETVNYRTQRNEKDGLFCEKIFGPSKDFKCYCGKYKGARYKGVVCDRCGVEVTTSSVRRERMGHIELATPVSHIWFLKGVPSKMGAVLSISARKLEKVVYFANYIVTSVDKGTKEEVIEQIEKEFETKMKALKKGKKKKNKEEKEDKSSKKGFTEKEFKKKKKKLKGARDEALEEIKSLKEMRILSEVEYHDLSLKYGEVFEAGTGAESLRKIFENIELKEEIKELKKKVKEKKNSKKLERRLRILQGMKDADIKPEWMFLKVLPVVPPGIRPMVQLDGGRYASSDLNDLYRRVINRNNRLKYLLDIDAPQVIVRNEKRMLQEAVDALLDNNMRKRRMVRSSTGGKRALKSMADILSGKKGRFRRNLLGKRVDYSGRSVIAVDPDLKLWQCGLPKKMALELFKPFIIQRLLKKEEAYNVRKANDLIDEKTDEVWEALEEVVRDKLVLLNRAPTLHRLGIQAFAPMLTEGEVIKIHPMVCKAFNADFDGDQMAVHLPLTEEAQKEARERMLSSKNLLKPATGLPIAVPTQDYILGCYYLTTAEEDAKGEGKYFGNKKDAELAYEFGEVDLRAKIHVRMEGVEEEVEPTTRIKSKEENRGKGDFPESFMETTVGRLMFNDVFPDEFPFQNVQMNSNKMNRIISRVLEAHDTDVGQKFLDAVKELGKEYATKSGVTWGLDDLKIPEEKEEIIEKGMKQEREVDEQYHKGLLSEEERRNQLIEIWQQAKLEIEEVVPKTLPKDNSIYEMVDSGARGSWNQPIQMMGMRGLMANPMGEIIELPIRSCFKEGLDVLEYFISTHGARKGTADSALRTASAGYLTRRLVDVAHQSIVKEEDCGDDEGIVIKKEEAEEIDQDFELKIVGRVVLEDVKDKNGEIIVKKGETINWTQAEKIDRAEVEKVKVRSPLTCKTKRGLCQKCYGWDLGYNESVELGGAVGIVAAQAIGEPGTQLTLRTFHTGGVAGGGDITSGLPRVEEIFEVRSPKGKAPFSEVEGEVVKVDKEKNKVQIKPSEEKEGEEKPEVIEYKIPVKRGIWVEKGDKVEPGDQICEGSLDLEKLLEVAGREKTAKYIINQIQGIYTSEGASIHDKHLEVVIRQMFSRRKVKKAGDSSFVSGEVVEKSQYLKEKEHLEGLKTKEAPEAEPILLGITKVSLTTQSLLSAASFQRTSQVLIEAAIKGQKDELKGLKENVMIGKIIPAGTGFEKD